MTSELAYVIAGVVVWFALRSVFPRAAGVILITLVIGAMVKVFTK